MSSKYTISDHQAPHFITFAVVQWEMSKVGTDLVNSKIDLLRKLEIEN